MREVSVPRIGLLSWFRLAEPRNYQEVLDRGYIPGRDLRIQFGDGGIERCMVVAHWGGIEPGTSELPRAVSELGELGLVRVRGISSQRQSR